MKFREKTISSGTIIFLGKDAESNDNLMREFEGKENVIMHTVSPGSPFCVIEKIKPSAKDIKEAAVYCAGYSQDWRDNREDVKVSIFTGKGIKKKIGMKAGTWAVKKSRTMIIKKKDIEKLKK